VLRFLGALPGALQSQLRSNRCLSSAIFSNLGAPFARSPLADADGRLTTAGLILESVEAVPPLRPLTYAGFAVLIYAGRLQVSMSYDPQFLTADEGGQLLSMS